MRGKPLLVAAATFLIVLIGGVAVAGVGTFGISGDAADTDLGEPAVLAVPDLDLPPAADGDEPAEPPTAKESSVEATAEDEAKPKDEPAKEPPADTATDETDEPKGAEANDESDHESKDPVDLFTITKPADGATVTSKTVTFGGEVADGTIVTRGKFTADQAEGRWSLTLVLAPGKNRVGFVAVGPDGAVQERSVTVIYDAPSDEKDDEQKKEQDEAAEYVFKAKQKYGSCGEDVPYDVFYGKGKPGSTISVSSPYGSGSTTVGEGGHWELKVTFPSAPAGEKFTVTVSASTGETATFSFVNTGGEHGKDH